MTASELGARLADVQRRLPALLLQGATEAALEGERLAKLNTTTLLRVRTGRLRNTVSGTAEVNGDEAVITLSAGGRGQRGPVPYGRIQEEGGTIKPVNGRFLAIPVGHALTAAGVARYPSPRDVPGLRFVPIRGGAMGRLVRDVGGRRARTDLYFLLVRSVTIRPKRYLATARDQLLPHMPGYILDPIVGAITAGVS